MGIDQRALVQAIFNLDAWGYACVHTIFTTVIICAFAFIFNADRDLLLAMTAVCATGSLFATPAIVRSVGFPPLKAMAFTITSTLLMPVVLYINMFLFSGEAFRWICKATHFAWSFLLLARWPFPTLSIKTSPTRNCPECIPNLPNSPFCWFSVFLSGSQGNSGGFGMNNATLLLLC